MNVKDVMWEPKYFEAQLGVIGLMYLINHAVPVKIYPDSKSPKESCDRLFGELKDRLLNTFDYRESVQRLFRNSKMDEDLTTMVVDWYPAAILDITVVIKVLGEKRTGLKSLLAGSTLKIKSAEVSKVSKFPNAKGEGGKLILNLK